MQRNDMPIRLQMEVPRAFLGDAAKTTEAVLARSPERSPGADLSLPL